MHASPIEAGGLLTLTGVLTVVAVVGGVVGVVVVVLMMMMMMVMGVVVLLWVSVVVLLPLSLSPSSLLSSCKFVLKMMFY